MRLNTRSILVALLVALSWCAKAQRKDNQTLLWRISGKGMTRPSYLFGTLHLKDNRLFRFDDSVYAAIEHTDGLALELNLNEFAAYTVNKMFDERNEDDTKIKDVMSEEELKKMEKPLTKKFNKDIDHITTKDIVREKNKWLSDYFKKGEMSTFVDAYLYDLARRQGKWLGGIEDIQDQASLVDGKEIHALLNGAEPVSIETMINVYTSQDIDSINSIMNNYDSSYRDALLIRRNKKMARRMDSLSALRPMFFAVGAAHLPGDSGVIKLLRARGFNVEPVFSDNKIYAKKYKFTEVPRTWQEVADEKALYKISMPGIPASIKAYGLIELKFFLELSNMSGYCTMAVVGSGFSNTDSAYQDFAERMFKKGKINAPKKIENSGVAGAEYTGNMDDYAARMQIFQSGNITYMAWVYGKKKDYVETEEADHFFASLKLTPHTSNGKQLYTYTDTIAAVTFRSPAKVEKNEQLTKQTDVLKGSEIIFNTGQDEATGAYIMFLSKQCRPGYSIPNDSTELAEMAETYALKFNAKTKQITIDGCRGLEMEGTSDQVFMKMRLFIRGNRVNALMSISEKKADDGRLEDMFSSMKILPYKRQQWKQTYDSAHTFYSLAPTAYREKYPDGSSSSVTRTRIFTYDSLSASNYIVTTDTLNKYTCVTNDSTFLDTKVQEFLSDDDSLVWQKQAGSKADMGIEALIRKEHSDVYQRLKICIHGNIQYNLTSSGEKAEVTSSNADQFFSSFTPVTPVTFKIHEHKNQALFKDLQSNDSVIRNEAYDALNIITFEKSDLPLMHKAMFLDYLPIAGYPGDKYSINDRLAYCISTVKDPSSIKFAKENYLRLTNNKQSMKYTVLELLAQIKTKESYKVMGDLMLQSPLADENYAALSDLMSDSLQLLSTVFPTLLKLAGDTSVGPMIAGFTGKLLDSGLITNNDIAAGENSFIALSAHMLPMYQEDAITDANINYLMNVLDSINTPASIGALEAYLSIQNIYLKEKVAIQLVTKGKQVAPWIWDGLAAESGTREVLYYNLNDLHLEALFPEKYLTQADFARSEIFNTVNPDSDDIPDSMIQFIKTYTYAIDDTASVYYLYKVIYAEGRDTTAHLGVVGRYHTDGRSVMPASRVTGTYWEEYNDDTIDEQFRGFINMQDEEEQ